MYLAQICYDAADPSPLKNKYILWIKEFDTNLNVWEKCLRDVRESFETVYGIILNTNQHISSARIPFHGLHRNHLRPDLDRY